MHVHGGNGENIPQLEAALIYFMCAWRKLMVMLSLYLLHVCMKETLYASVDILNFVRWSQVDDFWFSIKRKINVCLILFVSFFRNYG